MNTPLDTLDDVFAGIAANQAIAAAEQRYNDLLVELQALETPACPYLTDSNVDAENVGDGVTPGSLEYWNAVYSSACMAAGDRAADYGLSINALLGRVVF